MRLLLLVLLVLALAAGCGGDEEDAAPATTAQAPEPASECVATDSSFMTPLGNAMKDMVHRLRNGQAVRSEDHERIYFVSAEVYGPGVEEGTIGTWATSSLGGAEGIWTVDDVSRQYTDLRDGAEAADVADDDHGVARSRACVEEAG